MTQPALRNKTRSNATGHGWPFLSGTAQTSDMRLPLSVLALVVFSDAMLWQAHPGLSLAVLSLTVVGAAYLLAPPLPKTRARLAGVTALFAVAPVFNLVQPLSVFLLLFGLSTSLCLIAGVGTRDLFRSALRYPLVAACATYARAMALRAGLGNLRPSETSLRHLVMAWALPVALSAVFLLLFAGANPVISRMTADLMTFKFVDLPVTRIAFWAAMAIALSGALRAHRLYAPLTARRPARHTVKRPGLLNGLSVTRSLVLFNLIFAVQTLSDLFFLYGTSELPYGMSYASYAHRGAYPLLATALMAGGFAVLARPFVQDHPLLKAALLVWLAQTLALVFASLLRLEIYVDAYGLTRLRVAAGIWMGVVALGLGLVIWQVQQRRDTAWMLSRAALLGLGALYISAFFNIDGWIAEYNLTHDVPRDRFYLCGLSEAAILPIERHTGNVAAFCHTRYGPPDLFTPKDWREWGFRNWRLRTSLAALKTETTP